MKGKEKMNDRRGRTVRELYVDDNIGNRADEPESFLDEVKDMRRTNGRTNHRHQEHTQSTFVIKPLTMNSPEEFIDYYFTYLIKKYQFEVLSLILRTMPVAYYSTAILMKSLEVTFPVRHQIAYRDCFWKKVLGTLKMRGEYNPKMAELRGEKPDNDNQWD